MVQVGRAEKTNAYVARRRDTPANDETDGSKPKSNPLDRDTDDGGTQLSSGDAGNSRKPRSSTDDDDTPRMYVYSKMDTYF